MMLNIQGMNMGLFQKKPVKVLAEQFHPEQKPWPKGVYEVEPKGGVSNPRFKEIKYKIDTLEGPFQVTPGDWIIEGIKGERYPCKPDIFAATYDAVDS